MGSCPGLSDYLYLTIGTGIGGGALVNGRLLHGLFYSEMGHIRIPHDWGADPFPGICPFHRDCLEGLASGQAIEERWGRSGVKLPEDHAAWALEGRYLALALANWVLTLSPKRIVIGGGVMQHRVLFSMLKRELQKVLNGYVLGDDIFEGFESYLVPAALGTHSGVLGGIKLAEDTLTPTRS